MKKLLKEYGFNCDMQYFEMIIESFINGQNKQALNQFKALPKKDRLRMVKALYTNWSAGVSSQNKELLFDNILSK